MNSTLYNSRPFGIISPRKQMEYSENSIDVRYERKLLVFINWLDFLDKLPDAEVFVSIKVDDIIESLDLRKLRSETEKRTDLVFNLWSSDKPPNSFSNSFKGIEIFLVSMKDLVFKKLADGFLCAQFLINDSRRHMVCLPLLKGKSYQKSNHNFTEVEKFVGDSLCAVCGNFVLIKNKCRVCSCGLFVHAECLKNKAIKLPCRTNVGKVLLTYCCVEDFVVPLPNYKSFIKCCLEQKYFDAIVAIVHSLNTDERSEVLRTYLEVLEACSLDNTSYAVQFLKQVTSQEIINASSLSTLFRGNSVASKSLDVYYRITGASYLHKVLCSPLSLVISEYKSCEISPREEPDDNKRKENLQNLYKYVELIFSRIVSSDELFPSLLQSVFISMRMEIEKKFSSEKDAVYSLLNSFVFLRFLVTCILNPKKFGVCLSISDDKLKLAARNLELIGKTLQGIANMLPMGLKEAYLGVLNPLAARLIPEMKLFIDRISTDHGNTKMPSLENLICPCNTIEKVKVGVQDGETFAKHLSKLSRVFYQARERVYASNMVRKIPALKGPLSDIFSVLEKIYD